MIILYQNGNFYVIKGAKAYEVYKNTGTHATRVATIGLTGENYGLKRAIQEADKRARASKGNPKLNKYKVTVEVEARNAQEARRIVESSSNESRGNPVMDDWLVPHLNRRGLNKREAERAAQVVMEMKDLSSLTLLHYIDGKLTEQEMVVRKGRSNPAKSFAFVRLNYASPQGQPAYQLYRSFGAKLLKADTVFGEQAVQGWRDFYTRKGWVEVAPPSQSSVRA